MRREGLLLVRPVTANQLELEWASEYLGYRLERARLQATSVETERRLRRERDLLQSVLDRATDPIMLTDAEGRLVIANQRAERLFATREDESEGRRRAVAINNMLFSSALGRSAVEPMTSAPREIALVDPTEGSDLLFELISTTAGDARVGMGIVSILRNVSDLRRATEEIQENYRRLRAAEAEVRAERDRLDLVIDSVADPILVTDPSGNLVMMNTPAERFFSASEESSLAEAQRVQANDANFTSFVSNLLFGKTGESKYQGGVNLVDPKTGQQVPVEAVSGNVYGDPAEVSAIVTILHDRTEAIEREQLYEQLKAASAQLERRVQEATSALVHQNELLRRQALELEQASLAKSQFLANVSHDVRTPLNAILGYTSLLLRGVSGPLSASQRESLARVDANGRHLLTLINEILDISRIEAGKMPVRFSSIKLKELLDEIMAESEPLVARSNLVVTANVPEDLPAIRSDRQKVKQILLNLLTNALKFTPRGSVTVSCTHPRSSRELAIAVADTGIGIAAADQARIFEAFSQADPSYDAGRRRDRPRPGDLPPPRRRPGRPDHPRERAPAGLDLHPRPSSGVQAAMTKRTTEAEPRQGVAAGAADGPLVLIVDDVQDNRTVYVLFLKFSGYRVAEAENGVEALRQAEALMPDIIVMDLSLPVMDGWEATRRLKRDPRTRKIPVVVLTGHALPEHAQAAREAGCDLVITKPCLPDQLLDAIRRILDSPKPRPKNER